MSIKLRVVGIFYSVELKASDVNGSVHPGSVEAVLDAAVRKPGSGKRFGYLSSQDPKTHLRFVNTFGAYYDKPFTSPISHQHYDKGTYILKDNPDFDLPSYTVWQYYLIDENNNPKKTNPRITSYTEDVGIRDGYTVIWRLVTVRSGPVDMNPRQRKLLDL